MPEMAKLCESYEQAWQAALYWTGVPGWDAAEIAADFRRLITALEHGGVADRQNARSAAGLS